MNMVYFSIYLCPLWFLSSVLCVCVLKRRDAISKSGVKRSKRERWLRGEVFHAILLWMASFELKNGRYNGGFGVKSEIKMEMLPLHLVKNNNNKKNTALHGFLKFIFNWMIIATMWTIHKYMYISSFLNFPPTPHPLPPLLGNHRAPSPCIKQQFPAS